MTYLPGSWVGAKGHGALPLYGLQEVDLSALSNTCTQYSGLPWHEFIEKNIKLDSFNKPEEYQAPDPRSSYRNFLSQYG